MKNTFSFVLQVAFIALLTAITQIGGVIWIIAWLIAKTMFRKYRYATYFGVKVFVFSGLYLASTFLIVPIAAKKLGRVPLPLTSQNHLQPTTIWTVILNRHYVKPQLKSALFDIAKDLNSQYPDAKLSYLDANFPFYDGFRLLPHLSHNDGRKIDLSFMYQESDSQKPTDLKPSFSGYGVFEEPKQGEENRPKKCQEAGYFQYDMAKYVKIIDYSQKVDFDALRTKAMLQIIARHPTISKMLLEPYLKTRLGIKSKKWRLHGCGATRHDDHVHIQL